MLRRPPARHLGAHAATTPCGPAEPRGPPMTDATDATDATDPTDPTANGQPPSRLRRSPLDDRHRALGATMTAFGGWDMPLDYGSVVAEHRAVRSTAGVVDLKEALACLAVQGPRSLDVVRSGAGVDPGDLDYLDCQVLGQPVPAAKDLAVLARSGYTGERGYELFVPAGQAPSLWDRLVAAGAVPVGLAALDTLRLEMGYPLHGADIYLDASPVEARLGWAFRGSGFRGAQAYRRHTNDPAARRLLGLRATGRGIPRAGQIVFRAGGQQPVGETTSGTFSPTLGLGIALAYMDSEIAEGDALEVDVRGRRVAVVAARPPFVDADPRA